ncbi:hypothetical protein QNI16_23570 [Cytophagaceae bacterium YF14B1]|uniref:Uncharacterized protein n=1 Tax=Xanthocytophaga flava TaxID=3048013 RepID=A0AAE3UAM9_9BACT|nr:hypothetical protein [Xanthocytophaga flavus]MDJ1483498.1 hypothetical protein [Xanthocytophaga flavus]
MKVRLFYNPSERGITSESGEIFLQELIHCNASMFDSFAWCYKGEIYSVEDAMVFISDWILLNEEQACQDFYSRMIQVCTKVILNPDSPPIGLFERTNMDASNKGEYTLFASLYRSILALKQQRTSIINPLISFN